MADLGNKHECLSCGTKFYDLGRSQLVCPSCGEDQEELAKGAEEGDPSGAKAKSSAKKAKKTKKAKKAKKSKKTEADEASEDKGKEASSSDK